VREGSAAAVVAPFYSGDAAAAAHGARTLPPWGTVVGLRAPWATAAGARIPAVVPHSGRNLAPPGSKADRWRHP
jgi:hypothetical protein